MTQFFFKKELEGQFGIPRGESRQKEHHSRHFKFSYKWDNVFSGKRASGSWILFPSFSCS